MSAAQLIGHARRLAIAGSTGIAGYSTIKANTDPLQLFWDLDHTILCSISPLPENDTNSKDTTNDNNEKSILSPPTLQHFDQIDDDFPFDPHSLNPNTRTYFRPGAKTVIKLCSYFATNHVYTAAQESYTNNILRELDPDRTLFDKVIHRDDYPEIVKEGKDLTVGTNRLERAILFDDKLSNFKPQNFSNGVGVLPYTAERVEKCNSWGYYFGELGEMARLAGIAYVGLIHWSGDVRELVRSIGSSKKSK